MVASKKSIGLHFDLDGKISLITGAGRGIGRTVALNLARAGSDIALVARSQAELDSVVQEIQDLGRRAAAFPADLTQIRQLESLTAKISRTMGGIDVLVNNAGYGLLGPVEATDPGEYRPLFEVNFFGAAEVIRALLPYMRQRRSGYIINTTSIGGFAASPGFGFYAASKFAMEGLSEAVALDTAVFGIKVTILEPGSTRTDFAGGSMTRTARVIEEYQQSAVQSTLDRMNARHGAQPGDPHRLAKILLKFSRMEEPPLRFTTGEDGLSRMRNKLQATTAETEKFARLSLAVEFGSDVDLDQ